MFSTRFTTKTVDIKHLDGVAKISISMAQAFIAFNLVTETGRYYKYTGRKAGPAHGALQLSVKFNDKQKTISVNKGIKKFKIIFHKTQDYEKIKKKAVYYKHMSENRNSIKY